MKRIYLFLFLLIVLGTNTLAQKVDFRINAGGSISFVSGFDNPIIRGDDFIVPEIYSPYNISNPEIFEAFSTTKSKATVAFDVEIRIKIKQKLSISFSIGYNQVRFEYDTYISGNQDDSYYLSEVIHGYGDTRLHYMHLGLANISYPFFKDKLIIQAGPFLGYLLNNYINYYYYQYNSSSIKNDVKHVFFEPKFQGGLTSLTLGVQVRAEFQLYKKIYLYAAGRYYSPNILNVSQLLVGVSFGF